MLDTKIKTQLSLILLAGVGTVGLIGFFFHSVRSDFTLYNHGRDKVAAQAQSAGQAANEANAASLAATDENGAVLGAETNGTGNPFSGIYVNPFPGGQLDSSLSAQRVADETRSGDALLLSAMQPKPSAPIQAYLRGYTYPIVELDNCSSKNGCFTYCEQLANIPVCAMFAERQGYMKAEMVPVAQRLAVAFLSDGHFSSCKTAGGCVAICDDTSHAKDCATVAGKYQLDERVLGASVGGDGMSGADAAALSYNSLTNPYASLSQNYIDPALGNTIAANSTAGCAVLDMLCQSQSSSPGVNPRVLNVGIGDGGDGGTGGPGGGGTGGPNGDLNDCVNGFLGPLGNIDEKDLTQDQINEATQGAYQCGQTYVSNSGTAAAQAAIADAEAQKQAALSNIQSFQNCMTGSANLAADLQKCISQELKQ